MRIVVLNETASDERGAAQGLLNVSISIGQLLGAAMVGGITASYGGGAPGYQATYMSMGGLTAALIILASLLRTRAAEQAAVTAAA